MIRLLISLLVLSFFNCIESARAGTYTNLLGDSSIFSEIHNEKPSDFRNNEDTVILNPLLSRYYFKESQQEATTGIKIDVFGPFRGYSQITYEKAIEAGKSYELSLGIIGLGRNQAFQYSDTVIQSSPHTKSQFGVFVGIGYKFNKLGLFDAEDPSNHTHILQGLYAKPIFYLGFYNENRIAGIGNKQFALEKPKTTFAALQVEFGKQWVIEDKMLLDFYGGIGYGIDNKKYYSTSYYTYTTTSAFNYCNDRIGRSPGISVTMGIKVGLLIK